jgi:ATP-binding cassette subfamily B protein
LNKSLSNITFIGTSPRIGIEGLGMILISFFAYKLSTSKDGLVNAIPILGTLALGAQRILPILQQAFGSWSAMKGGTFALKDTIKLLKQTLPYYALNTNLKKIKFEQEIEFKNITFSYSSDKQILSNINLKIRKGSVVGIVGITGSGKSTFLDILMALQTPTSGEFLVDSKLINQNNFREWQLNISHVPQNIFLSDASILENIAFGVPLDKIDYNKALDACNYAQLNQTINSLEEGMYTNVGERGVKLSGGQKQRIGLARALYKNSNILILDEATSALDNETENNVMNSVMNLPKNITIIIVAHRLTTLKNCTNIIKIEDGQLFETTTLNELIKA